jgi:thiosulfate/3-mercaptopyruvate sulfurtransferase
VSTEWLASRLGASGLKVADASWYLPGSGRDAASEYAAGHIPGAIFFDIDDLSDRATSLPHMLPDASAFEARMAALGLNSSDQVVVYDGSGVNLSAPRAWWMLRTFGHEQVAVLDGGLNKWRREERALEPGTVTPNPGNFKARFHAAGVRDLEAVWKNIDSRKEQLVDVRVTGRFLGVEPEPRPGLRGGHVPGSINLPFTKLVRPDGTLLPLDEMRRTLMETGIDLTRPIIATCGSGTSACALLLSLHAVGHTDAALYDGAWAEWGGRADTPVEGQAKT